MDVIAIRSELKRLKDTAKKAQKRKAAGAFTRYNLQVAACIAVILGFDGSKTKDNGIPIFTKSTEFE